MYLPPSQDKPSAVQCAPASHNDGRHKMDLYERISKCNQSLSMLRSQRIFR